MGVRLISFFIVLCELVKQLIGKINQTPNNDKRTVDNTCANGDFFGFCHILQVFLRDRLADG